MLERCWIVVASTPRVALFSPAHSTSIPFKSSRSGEFLLHCGKRSIDWTKTTSRGSREREAVGMEQKWKEAAEQANQQHESVLRNPKAGKPTFSGSCFPVATGKEMTSCCDVNCEDTIKDFSKLENVEVLTFFYHYLRTGSLRGIFLLDVLFNCTHLILYLVLDAFDRSR